MSVALLALALVLSSIAWAIVWSSSRSLVSRRDRSNWGPDVIRVLSLTPAERCAARGDTACASHAARTTAPRRLSLGPRHCRRRGGMCIILAARRAPCHTSRKDRRGECVEVGVHHRWRGTEDVAASGSFRPLPVRTQTTSAPGGAPSRSRPATPAALAGSQNTASSRGEQPPRREDLVVARPSRCARRTASTASRAPCQLAGLPMRIAVATVSGCSTTWPSTIGAAPAAWKPCSARRRVAPRPPSRYATEALPVGRDVAGVADRARREVGRARRGRRRPRRRPTPGRRCGRG